MTDMTCGEFREMSVELALGVADAHDGAAAFAHLEHCRACRQEIGQLSDLADGLAALAPSVEPPAGFESRVLANLSSIERPTPLRRPAVRRGPVWLTAAAALIVVVGGIGWVLGNQGHPGHPATGRVLVSTLTGDDRPVGQVVIDRGPAPWMSMAIGLPSGRATVRCQLLTVSGGTETVGTFAIWNGYGYWAAPIPPSSSPIDGAQVVDMHGRVLATASLPTERFGPASSV